MKTLAALEDEAKQQDDPLNKPRKFIAIFPAGARNGHFLDPWMGLIKIDGMNGFIQSSAVDPHNVPAMWVD